MEFWLRIIADFFKRSPHPTRGDQSVAPDDKECE